jgi:hypothetical protein
MVLDLNLILGALGIKVYLILDFLRYPLLKSILLDNCGVTHVVNDVRLLDKGSFILERLRYIVKARSSSLLILGRDTYIIKSILNGKRGKVNLVLNNVAIMEGFHVNIILKALLYKRGAWYYKYNKTLRFKDKYKSIILLNTTCLYNIVFIKYKLLLTYLNALSVILINISGVLVYPTLK